MHSLQILLEWKGVLSDYGARLTHSFPFYPFPFSRSCRGAFVFPLSVVRFFVGTLWSPMSYELILFIIYSALFGAAPFGSQSPGSFFEL